MTQNSCHVQTMGFRSHYPTIWHRDILSIYKLEEFEKTAEAGSLPTFPETGHKTLMWKVPSLYLEERNILMSLKTKGLRELSKQTVLAKSPPVYCTYFILLDLWTIIFLRDCPLFINRRIKILGSNCFCGSSFPCEASWIKETYFQ